MNESIANSKVYFSRIKNYFKNNIKLIIIILSLCFLLFLAFQIFSFYSKNKILTNSKEFYNIQNIENTEEVKKIITQLSQEKNFYAILSKLELIDLNLKSKNYDKVLDIYKDLLKDKKINNIYKSSIALKASYEFININLNELSKNYLDSIKLLMSYIDDELDNYKGSRLELNYLLSILNLQINNIEYTKSMEAIDIYNNIQTSDFISPAIKERVKKIHEFFSYKK